MSRPTSSASPSALLLVAFLSVAGACQQTPEWETAAKGLGNNANGSLLADVRLQGEFLSAHAFAAEAAFLYPEESRTLVHAIFRAEFARLEGMRLQLEVPAAEVDAALQSSVAGLEGSLPDGVSLDDWAQRRFDRNWQVVNGILRRHLEQNQLFQLCARAHSRMSGQVELQMLSSQDVQQAKTWARQLQTGAAAAQLAIQSLDPGPNGDASLPPLPMHLPAPLGPWLQQGGEERIFGPFQFDGEQVWRVVFVKRRIAAETEVPPRAVLLEDLRKQPVSPLEERAWFEAMVDRYNAVENLPAIQAPAAAFVRNSSS